MNDDAAREAAFARAYRTIRSTIERKTDVGQRLLVGTFTRATGLSPTPVREALSRLVGEGLVEEHRGGGYFIPRLDARDVVEHYALARSLALAAIAEHTPGQSAHRTRRMTAVQQPFEGSARRGMAYWTERLAIASGNRLLAVETHRLNGRMAGIRRAEVEVLSDLATWLEDIGRLVEAADREGLTAWIERYCTKGCEQADEIADWLAA